MEKKAKAKDELSELRRNLTKVNETIVKEIGILEKSITG